MSTKKVGSHSSSEKKKNKQNRKNKKKVHDNEPIQFSEVVNKLNSPYVG